MNTRKSKEANDQSKVFITALSSEWVKKNKGEGQEMYKTIKKKGG